MSVADYFGLDDPESPLMTEARAGWTRWCADDPVLAVVDDLAELRAWTRRATREDKDRVLGRLAGIAADEETARTALVWLLLPGAITLADGLRDLTHEIDELVAGQLWIEVARSDRHPLRGVAKAILNSTRRAVLAELGVGSNGKARDRVWSEKILLDSPEDLAVPVEPERVNSHDELVEVLDAALRDNAVDGIDIWLLHELAVAADAEDAPLRRGRCGLTSPALVDVLARLRPEAARTLRRRVDRAVDQLTAYVDCWQDEARLARWRAEHPHRLPSQKELIETERVYDEYLTGRGRGPGWERRSVRMGFRWCCAPRLELGPDPVRQRRGRVVVRQRLAGNGPIEQPSGIVPLALQPVELTRQLQGVVVAAADVLDDLGLPAADDVGVTLVDPAREVAVVRRGRFVLRRRAGQASVVVGDALSGPPQGDFAEERSVEDVGVPLGPGRQGVPRL